jgi:copper homeostasis protein (lipoprotein)
MNHKPLVASALLCLALVGCKREETPAVAPPEVVAQPATAPVASATASRSATPDLAGAGVEPNAAGFSSKAFAGTFHGTLPCADCPGIDETLELKPDGSFRLTDVYRDRPAGTHEVAGSWTSEADDSRIRLDPNSKGEDDRTFSIVSNDELAAVGSDGKPLPGPAQRLTRGN